MQLMHHIDVHMIHAVDAAHVQSLLQMHDAQAVCANPAPFLTALILDCHARRHDDACPVHVLMQDHETRMHAYQQQNAYWRTPNLKALQCMPIVAMSWPDGILIVDGMHRACLYCAGALPHIAFHVHAPQDIAHVIANLPPAHQ